MVESSFDIIESDSLPSSPGGGGGLAAGVPTTSVQALDRAVALLEALAAAGQQGISLKDVTNKVGLRPSTGRTLLASLVTHGLAAQIGHSRRYLLGSRFFELNRVYLTRSDLTAVAEPVVRELWEQTRETVMLAVLHGTRRVNVSVVISPQLLSVNPTSAPPGINNLGGMLFRTAGEKVLLAGLTLRERSDVLAIARRQGAIDENASAALMEEFDQVGAKGYATNVEEAGLGVCGVAAPVLDQSARIVAALCIGYPSVRHTPTHHVVLRDAVVDHAAKLSRLLGADPRAQRTFSRTESRTY